MTTFISIPAIAYVIVSIVTSVVVFVLIYELYFRKFIRVIILRKIGEMYKQVKQLKPKLITESVDYKGKTYTINFDKAIMDNRNRPILYYNQDDSEPLTYYDNKIIRQSSVVNGFVHSDMIKDIFSSGSVEKVYIYLVLGMAICLVIVSVFAIWKITELQNTIIQIATKPTNSTVIQPINPT